MVQLRLRLDGDLMILLRDGDRDLRAFYERHYSARRYRDGRRPRKIVGPGEYLICATPEIDAVIAFRRARRRDDGQAGVECCFFRNESSYLSSRLIRHGCRLAWLRWPRQRLFTYVDPAKVQSGLPGACFLFAGWRYVRGSGGHRARSAKRRLLLLECLAPPILRGRASLPCRKTQGFVRRSQREEHR